MAEIQIIEKWGGSVVEKTTGASTELRDFSGLDRWFVHQNIEPLVGKARRIVTFPDLGPTGRGLVPTGCVAEFDMDEYPEWLRHVRGADIGCGMTLARFTSPITGDEFTRSQTELDSLAQLMRDSRESAVLGGGNHFLDFVTDGLGEIGVVIHAGSFGNGQRRLADIVDKLEREGRLAEGVELYLQQYRHVIDSAAGNRSRILELVQRVYGRLRVEADLVHNTVEVMQREGLARVYKGAIKVSSAHAKLLLPSSMGGWMVWYTPGGGIGENTLWGAPHGTGRKIARSDVNKGIDPEVYPRIMVPTGLRLPVTELPQMYRDLASTEKALLRHNLMGYQQESDVEYLRPVGYIGHL